MNAHSFESLCLDLERASHEPAAGNTSFARLSNLHRNALSILSQTKVTKAWRSDELPDFLNNARERRGVLEVIDKWRDLFWRKNLGALLQTAIEHDLPWHERSFWMTTLPEQWFSCDKLSSPPPMAPSHWRPSALPYASNPAYVEWVNEVLLEQLVALMPVLAAQLLHLCYDPLDLRSSQQLGKAITMASTVLLSEKLGFFENNCEQSKVIDYLSRGGRFVNFRYRGSRSMLWPADVKRPYVDLYLAPVHAQVLLYEDSARNASGPLRRSLPLRDGGISGNDAAPSFTYLKRIDIELATWSETMVRLIEFSPRKGTMMASADLEENPSPKTGRDALAPHQRAWAKAILEACKPGPASAHDDNRFLQADCPLASRQIMLVDIPGGFKLIPPESSMPVLEQDVLRLHLDWSVISPKGEWMDLHLAVLLPERTEPEWLEFTEIESLMPDDENFCELALHGQCWEALKQDLTRLQLITAFANLQVGCKQTALANGAFVLLAIDLKTTFPTI